MSTLPAAKPRLLARNRETFAAGHLRARYRGVLPALLLAGLASACTILTFLAMSGRAASLSTPQSILILLLIDLALLLALATLVLRHIVGLWSARRSDALGRRLHLRLLSLFGLVTAFPTLLVSVFSLLVVILGLQDWLGDRVRSALGASLAVANAYLDEHRQGVAADLVSMSDGLLRAGIGSELTSDTMHLLMERQISVLRLNRATVFFTEGATREIGVIAEVVSDDAAPAPPEISDWALARADEGEVVILHTETQDRVRGLRYLGAGEGPLDQERRYYLLVSRNVDAQVLGHMQETSSAVQLYERLEGRRNAFIITFAAVFVVLSLLLLLSASWVGIAFANRLNRPLAALIRAAARLQDGDLSARVVREEGEGELTVVSDAFNRMSGAVRRQQEDLIAANRQLEERRNFIETTLAGVSSGVVALDRDGRVQMLNERAHDFFAVAPERILGRRLAAFSRELRDLFARTRAEPDRIHAARIEFLPPTGESARSFQVRMAARLENSRADGGGVPSGFVVTFDDLTETLAAQRKAAWADVARAIAHEIKNPLTPIQLSAERMERRSARVAEGGGDNKRGDNNGGDKNGAAVNAGDDTDARLEEMQRNIRDGVGTITRQVGEIRRLVDEFSSFARMPEPKRQATDLAEIMEEVREILAAEAESPARAAAVSVTRGDEFFSAPWIGDSGQLRRALHNLARNALLAIDERRAADADAPAGEVALRMRQDDRNYYLVIEDNGAGLPAIPAMELLQPYVTTRRDGSGLGLAVVQKIAEDHGGALSLRGREDRRGAVAVLRLPKTPVAVAGET
ncbi:MAG: ATP-binding protein [Alphaproteobacteria bacterium]|nr:ATP-binding protein [Alphaproteobacteria bacterium]MDA7988234.1 ATP-binding protein [Alphaproteobacteria bacterium]MDA8008830.1 ATP-binding protein [Alphaproteobacteria bacterium]